jgi:hypothetical protein
VLWCSLKIYVDVHYGFYGDMVCVFVCVCNVFLAVEWCGADCYQSGAMIYYTTRVCLVG